MAIQIQFDALGNPEEPTLILAKKNGQKMGQLKATGITMSDNLNDASEIQFEVHKYEKDGKTLTNLWYSIIDFRLIWCKEWDMWFQLTVDLDEETETIKTVFCEQLGQAELSQINLYDIQINNEEDIEREDYEIPTVLWNPEHPEASLLHRIMENAPHYSVAHVDDTIKDIQRTFSFDNESIYDAFLDIAEEIECIFILDSDSNEDGSIRRTVSVYDLQANCKTCGHRGDFTDKCPECGSTYIDEGYGNDTTIFITTGELADEIQFSTDTEAVKNCFKLEGGDDLMTATIRNCNPNGTDRIWYITEQSKADMSNELVQRLSEYDELYAYYQNDYVVEDIPDDMIEAYNELVTKYREYSEDIEYIPSVIVGYPALMEAYYNTIDFSWYLDSELMPDASLSDTSAEKEAAKLIVDAFGSDDDEHRGTVAVEDVSNISTATANSAVLAMAKVIVDERYQVKVNEGELGAGQQWTGNFKVTNYSDDEDTAISETITLTITDDYEEYLRQMIEKELNKEEVNDLSITYLFGMDYDDFCEELKKYCLQSLISFYDAGQACLDILIEQGVADKETWGSDDPDSESNLYEKLYLHYYKKQSAIEAEIKLREEEIALIQGTYDEDGYIDEYGLQTYLYNERNEIQSALNFEEFMGEDLWLEFSAFRREDKFSNANYISDGLNNAEEFARALEFLEIANEEIYKSAELQHQIAATLRDLLVIDKFAPIVDYFSVGNWLRAKTDDSVYKLRLIGYEIDFDNPEKLSVDFSDVFKTLDGISDKKSVLDQASSMASSYGTTQHQASQGSKSYTVTEGWTSNGLDVDNVRLMQTADNETQTWDSHGMLFRRYDDVSDTFYSEQLKIIHSTMTITDDNWETVKTAVGGFYYTDPYDDTLKYAYGINGEVLIGKLILGETLGIYNENGTLSFDKNGLRVYNDVNMFTVNPSADDGELLKISRWDEETEEYDDDIFYVDKEGLLYARDANIEGVITTTSGLYTTEMRGGQIRFYYDGVLYGNLFATYHKDYEDIRGINLSASYAGSFVSFGHQNVEDADYNVYYQISFDDRVNAYPETHHFYGSAGFSSTIYPYSSITFQNNGYGIWFTNTDDDNASGIYMSSSDNIVIGAINGDTNGITLQTGGSNYRVRQNLGSDFGCAVPVFYWYNFQITTSASDTTTAYAITFNREYPSTPQCIVCRGGEIQTSTQVELAVSNVSATGATVYLRSSSGYGTFNVRLLIVG